MLQLTRNEVVDISTSLYQTENGTTFYRKKNMLWVTNDLGKKISTRLEVGPGKCFMSAHADSIYYGYNNRNRKIYRAVFKSRNTIDTYYVRDLLTDETLYQDGVCFRENDGKRYVYRMWDDPNRKREHFGIPRSALAMELKAMLGQAAIFREMSFEPIPPSVRRIGRNAIAFSCSRGKKPPFFDFVGSVKDSEDFNMPWGSKAIVKNGYVYMTNGTSLFTIDPIGLTMLPPLSLMYVSEFYIGGIYQGMLVGRGKCNNTSQYHVMMTQLPEKYVTNAKTLSIPATPANPVQELAEFSCKLLNDFVVKKIRGMGAFGCVFEAVNKYDNCEYAVKRIAVNARDLENALGEVRAMAILDHAHVVRYNASWVERPPEGWKPEEAAEQFAEDNSGYTHWVMINPKIDRVFIYIQMQLCNHSLSDWLRDNQESTSRNLSRMKSWFKQIVSAVEYIHSKNLIHRDIKPSNVLFMDENHLKVCDLGIVTERRDENASLTTISRTSIGTMLYMSPEQRSWVRYIYIEDRRVQSGTDSSRIMRCNDYIRSFGNLSQYPTWHPR